MNSPDTKPVFSGELQFWKDDRESRPPRFNFPLRLDSGEMFTTWDLVQIPDRLISIDTETELIVEGEIPRMALTTVFGDSGTGLILHPDEIASFLALHRDRWFVGQNVVFDFWVILEALRASQEQDPDLAIQAISALWDIVRSGRLLDTMLLDQLIGSALEDRMPLWRDLAKLCREYCPEIRVDKEDPYRLRYNELTDVPKDNWEWYEEGFFSYAAKDPVATLRVFESQAKICRRELEGYEDEILPGAIRNFGPLSCGVQVKGAIALDYASKRGIAIDLEQVEAIRGLIEESLAESFSQVEELFGAEVFQRDKTGAVKLTPNGVARQSTKVVKEEFEKIAKEHKIRCKRVKDGSISVARSFWEQYRETDLRIEAYVSFQESAKLAQFFRALDRPRIFPKYNPYVRTGRSSCSDPNLQQLPRRDEFRRMIVADEGYYLLQIDYSAIELRTLAQVCLRRYGRSKLAEQFQSGIDPHAYSAARILKMEPEEFFELPKEERKEHRQRAKALNFGVPGGLGAKSLVAYAKGAYRVEMSLDEARDLRETLIREVYPELRPYLTEDDIAILAGNLLCSREALLGLFDYEARSQLRMALYHDEELPRSAAEESYRLIEEANQNPRLFGPIARREQIGKEVFGDTVVTLSGRKRGQVTFTQKRNTPFQSLAADGAKIAMFELLYCGFIVCGFVHDEVLIQIPQDCDLTDACNRVERIMIDSMAQVVPDVPIECEYLLADRWYKSAPSQPRDSSGRVIPYLGEELIV